MELIGEPLSRDVLNRIALYLYGARAGPGSGDLKRTLKACAMRLEAAARILPENPDVTPLIWPTFADLLEDVEASLHIGQRSAARMLALLLVEPGTTLSSHGLAAALGISHASVRVFAFHLRNWLHSRRMPNALECRWGVGYAISPSDARRLLQKHEFLRALVSAMRERHCACEDVMPPHAPELPIPCDPFPVVHHRALEAKVLA